VAQPSQVWGEPRCSDLLLHHLAFLIAPSPPTPEDSTWVETYATPELQSSTMNAAMRKHLGSELSMRQSDDAVQQQLCAMLQPLDLSSDLERHQVSYVAGTREWVFADVERWAARDARHPYHRAYWLQGTGGLGKSVIAAQLVKRYGKADSTPLHIAAHFFCKHDQASRNDPRKVICSLLCQLASELPEVGAVYNHLLVSDAERDELQAYAGGQRRGL